MIEYGGWDKYRSAKGSNYHIPSSPAPPQVSSGIQGMAIVDLQNRVKKLEDSDGSRLDKLENAFCSWNFSGMFDRIRKLEEWKAQQQHCHAYTDSMFAAIQKEGEKKLIDKKVWDQIKDEVEDLSQLSDTHVTSKLERLIDEAEK
jgi:hypothetical protein